MKVWSGTRQLTIVTACLNANGCPDLVLTDVEVTHAEYADGVHCERVEEQLVSRGYEEPFLHFDVGPAAKTLLPVVRQYLGLAGAATHPTATTPQPKESRCRASSR